MASTSPDHCTIWGVPLPRDALTDEERAYLARLPEEVPPIAWLWSEMDRVWHQLGLDSRRPLGEQPIEMFYGHPVWLMNGLFSAADPLSASHRRAIASYVASLAPTRVADFGGGFGELALRISRDAPAAEIEIIEPYPKPVALSRLADSPRVRFISELEPVGYDIVIAQDVLEHVEQPVDLAIHLAQSVKVGGTVIFANNFTPVIACHLPSTFYLRHTFRLVMRALGLVYEGHVPEAEHAAAFRVTGTLQIRRARLTARVSRSAAPAVEVLAALRRRLLGRRLTLVNNRTADHR